MKISWDEPYDNSEPIIDYEILILQVDGTLKASTECDGAQDPVKSLRYCYVQLSTLRSPTFSLPFRQTVIAIARARNKFGHGDYSEANIVGA